MIAPTTQPVDTLSFAKQPIHRVGVTSVPTSADSDAGMSDHSVSLLSPMLMSNRARSPAQPRPQTYDYQSPQSSIPSTAVSSPSGHGILRRESVSGAEGADRADLVTQLNDLSKHQDQRPCLKFAIAPPPAHQQAVKPLTSFQEENDVDSDGYLEDEEDGQFSSDEEYSAYIPRPAETVKYPFARPTHYHSPTLDEAEPAPALRPPPSRRGRGHIVVDDPSPEPKSCSRHCSPPPVRSREHSPASSRNAGPSGRRAGSPMPDVDAITSEEEEDEGEDEGEDDDERADDDGAAKTDIALPVESLGRSLPAEGILRHSSVRVPTGTQEKATDPRLSRARSLGTRRPFTAPMACPRPTPDDSLGWSAEDMVKIRRTSASQMAD